jgi:hypothetical protein
MKRFLPLLVVLLSVPAFGTTQTINTIPSSGASFLTTLQAFLRGEDANRYDLIFNDLVISGCTHSTGAGFTKSISSCVAIVGGYYVSNSASVTYNSSDTCYLAISADTTPSTINNFTRSGSSNFLVDCVSASTPTFVDADNAMLLAEVTTDGSGVTAFTQSYSTVPVGTATANQGLRTNASGVIEGTSQSNGQILIGGTGGKPLAATLTQGNGMSITNGVNSITLATAQNISTSSSPSFVKVTTTASTGTQPFTVASQTKVANLNAEYVDGGDWAAPLALGSTTPAAVTASTLKVPSSSGSAITGIYKGTAALDFVNTADEDCSPALTITVTGADQDDAVFLGTPSTAAGADRYYFAYVGSNNIVSVIFCNLSGSSVDPTSATFTAVVIH